MGRINKLEKFAQNQTSKNVIEPDKEIYKLIKGNWSRFFENENDIAIELACGWGEYTLALAKQFPQKNFIGIDKKGDRIWKGSRIAKEQNLANVAFLRTNITELPELFDEDEVDEIWLTFPDPRPKGRDEKHRLTNAAFLKKYRHLLQKEGWFRLKTDNTILFEYSLQVLADFNIRKHEFTFDLYRSELIRDHFGIRTKYESIWMAKDEKIKYMKFQFS